MNMENNKADFISKLISCTYILMKAIHFITLIKRNYGNCGFYFEKQKTSPPK